MWDTAVWKGFMEKTQLNSKTYRRIWIQKEKVKMISETFGRKLFQGTLKYSYTSCSFKAI